MPPGFDVIAPTPLPATETPRVCCCSANVAVTLVAAVTLTLHSPVPEQPPPDHPTKTDPTPGIAINSTAVPKAYVSEQSAPHTIPTGEDETVPPPLPFF